MSETGKVEIVEKQEEKVEEPLVEVAETDNPEEVKLAEKHGYIKPEEKKPEEDEGKEDEKDERVPSFEEVEKNEELISKYSKEQRGLFNSWKRDKKKRQEAQANEEYMQLQVKKLERQINELSDGSKASKIKLDQINQLLNGPEDGITVEAIQAIIGREAKKEDEGEYVSRKELEEREAKKQAEAEEAQKKQRFVQERITEAEEYGKSQFENYDEVVNLAEEVINGKVDLPAFTDTKELSEKLVKKLTDPKTDVEEVARFVHSIAKLNPEYGKARNGNGKKETKENIERMINNASKQPSSAAISGGKTRRFVSYEDMTADDAEKLSRADWVKLPKEVRERILKQ